MIAIRCQCGGELWVRDRLAGEASQCPRCKARLAIPSLALVRSTMTASKCVCGEAYWSSAWRPGRACRCPLCGKSVERAASDSTVVLRPPADQAVETRPARRSTKARRPLLLAASAVALAILAGAAILWGRAGADRGERSEASNPPSLVPPLNAPMENASTAKTDAASLHLIVPAYFYPTGSGLTDWERLSRAAASVPIVAIVNPASGPGSERNPDYQAAIAAASRAGVRLIGYVNTDYGRRDRVLVEEDVSRWLSFYPEIHGFFLDAQASEPAESIAAYYAGVSEFARRQRRGAFIVGNPGTICDRSFLDSQAVDVVICFENSEGFDRFELPPWNGDFVPDRFGALPYDVRDEARMKDALREAVLKGLGYVYVTQKKGSNPWDALPEYWEAEVEAVSRINLRQSF